MTVLLMAGWVCAANTTTGKLPAVVTPVVTGTAQTTADITSTAQALEKVPVFSQAFGYLGNSAVTVCVHDKKRVIDWQSLSPLDLKGKWHFRLKHKDRVADVADVLGLIEYTTVIDENNYYFYSVPEENKGNLIRFTDKGAFIRKLKFQVFSFIFVDVELEPEIQYLRFPMKAGDEWEEKSTGTVDLLGLIKITKQTTAKFKVAKELDVLVEGKVVHVYVTTSEIDRGDGKIFHEEDWFGEGTGLMYSDTEAYTLELESYEPGISKQPDK